MFKKSFTIKSNTNVRNTDRKKIFARLPEEASSFFTAKQQLSVVRIQNSLGVWLNVYVYEKNPVFFEPDTGRNPSIYPTVYFTWISPSCFPVLFVNSSVFEILESGADLMLPGVITGLDCMELPNFPVNSPVIVVVIDLSCGEPKFKGPMAVGKALMSSDEMLASGMKGRGVQLFHFYHDTLWEFGTKTSVPFFSLDAFTPKDGEGSTCPDAIPLPLGDEQEEKEASSPDGVSNMDILSTSAGESSNAVKEMEQLLRQTFFGAIRWKLSKKPCHFPIDAGQFYAGIVLKNLPEGHRIDMKKTRYKKFVNFLHQINENENGWVVKIANKKGIDMIEDINFDHQLIKNAENLPSTSDNGMVQQGSDASKVKVSECFSVTEAVLPFFRLASIKKGDVLQQNRIRELLLEYAREKALEKNGKIELDDTLQTIVKYFLPNLFPANDLVQKITAQMTKAFLITMDDGRQKVHRGKLPSIEFKVEKRCGNKVVTLINNATVFGLDSKVLCQRIQTGVATGTTIIDSAPNCEGAQILVHGNQVNYIGEHLMNIHGIQKKYMKGLELGVKEKKKKK